MRKTLITLVSIATLTLPLFAMADDEATSKSKPERRGPHGERAGERGPRGLGPEFASMSAEEKLAVLKERMEAHPKMAEMLTLRFDTDDDGQLSDTELAAAAEAMAKRGGKPRGPRGEAKGEGEGRGKGRGDANGEGRKREKRPARDAAE
ncbi:MAG: hypothetical protein O3C21_19065 [Verrucomicrobia bacterium]|nr:hypothetical protein [Verrucomicrobiota bacterium]